MAVIYVREIADGRSTTNVSTRGSTETRHVRSFHVKTNSRADAALDVIFANGLPQLGDVHPTDQIAFCRNQNANPVGKSPFVWNVKVTYSTAFPVTNNPLTDPPIITWSTARYQRPFIFDRAGTLVTNTAGDPFDPPAMVDDSRMSVTVRINLAVVPVGILAFRDSVNSSPFTIDNVDVGTARAKMFDVNVGEVQNRNTVAYRQLSYTMQIKDPDEPNGWQPRLANVGFYYKTAVVLEGFNRFRDRDGGDSVTPGYLAMDGSPILDENNDFSRDPTDAIFLTKIAFQTLNYNLLPGIA